LLQTVLLDCKSEYFLQLQDKNKLFLYNCVASYRNMRVSGWQRAIRAVDCCVDIGDWRTVVRTQ